jgi:hypothetical protein
VHIELKEFDSLGDDRGGLISLEENKNIPFKIKRVYYMYGTKPNERRGFHAHKELKQVAIALHGSCRFLLDDGHEKREVLLNEPNKGILIESFIWREMFDFTDDCVLLVLADAVYNEDDYIRDYVEFLEYIK